MAKRNKLITSVINHNIRVELGLTCDEYIVMDILLENYCAQPYDYESEIKRLTGFDDFTLEDSVDSLAEKGFVFISRYSPVLTYIISDKWLSKFNVDGDFQEFWTIFGEYGNKANSLNNYKVVRKSVDKETLHDAAKAYLAFCAQKYSDQKYINPAQTWLDPDKKRWEDKLKMIQQTTEELPKRVHEFI